MLSISLYAVLYLWLMFVTWVFYVAIMHMKANQQKLSTTAKVFAYPALGIGLVLDFIFNVASSVPFLEPPRLDKGEWLFTGRVSRWNDTGGWRGDLARWCCEHFLDPFEEGGHCS